MGHAHYADADDNRSLSKRLDMEKNLWRRYEDKNNRHCELTAGEFHLKCEKRDVPEDLSRKGLKIVD